MTMIDLSRIPPPSAIEDIDYEAMLAAYLLRFKTYIDELRVDNPSIPQYNVDEILADPIGLVGRTWTWLRNQDRFRVNDGLKALLAPLSKGSNLDNLVARQGIQRLVLTAATDTTPETLESDERLLERYLLSFGRAACGSRDAWLFAAYTAWPGAGDVEVVGRKIHGQPGDVHIVVSGPEGRDPTVAELALVSAGVSATNVQPEATAVSARSAIRKIYSCNLVLEVLKGPDPELVRNEAAARIRAAANERTVIGGEVPEDLLPGAAYGNSIIRVRDNAPVVIEAHPYSIPVLTDITLTVEVRT